MGCCLGRSRRTNNERQPRTSLGFFGLLATLCRHREGDASRSRAAREGNTISHEDPDVAANVANYPRREIPRRFVASLGLQHGQQRTNLAAYVSREEEPEIEQGARSFKIQIIEDSVIQTEDAANDKDFSNANTSRWQQLRRRRIEQAKGGGIGIQMADVASNPKQLVAKPRQEAQGALHFPSSSREIISAEQVKVIPVIKGNDNLFHALALGLHGGKFQEIRQFSFLCLRLRIEIACELTLIMFC